MSNRISGTVDRVFFTSAKFSAGALVRDDGDRVRFRGPFCVSEGELVTLTGQWKSDPKYGPQFDAKSVSYDLPETPEGLVQYLAKHPAFTGIGETTARKIVSYVASAEHLDRVTQPGQHCDSVRYVGLRCQDGSKRFDLEHCRAAGKVRWWWNRLFAATGSCQPEACEAQVRRHCSRQR